MTFQAPNQNANDMPRTPQAEYPQQVYNTSPLSSPKMMKNEFDFTNPPSPQDKQKQSINKQKKQYSIELYKWTRELIERDVERRESTDSNNSQDQSDDK